MKPYSSLPSLPEDWRWVWLTAPWEVWAIQIPDFKQPVWINFLDYIKHGRARASDPFSDPLAKAVGLRPQSSRHTLLDLTAGWGKDSVFLAQLGAEVTMVESNPVVGFLLEQALTKAKHCSWHASISLHKIDHQVFLERLVDQVDVIYLDPMFDDHFKRKARVRQASWVLRALNPEVPPKAMTMRALKAALSQATDRVVIKLPARANTLSIPATFSLRAGPCKLEVYQVSQANCSKEKKSE